jgi:hypothetical protein
MTKVAIKLWLRQKIDYFREIIDKISMNKNNNIRPSAEIRFAEELKALADNDTQERPPGWKLSPKAVIHYLLEAVHSMIKSRLSPNT